MATVTVPKITLPNELAQATLGGVIAGLGTFVGALTVTSASNLTSLKAAAIGGGFTLVTFFSNSLNAWYKQQNSSG